MGNRLVVVSIGMSLGGQKNVFDSLLLFVSAALGVFVWILGGLQGENMGTMGGWDTFLEKGGTFFTDLNFTDLTLNMLHMISSHFIYEINGCKALGGWWVQYAQPCSYVLNSNSDELQP